MDLGKYFIEDSVQIAGNDNFEEDAKSSPLPIEVIPNYMGANLCTVDRIDWRLKADDYQLMDLTIHFIPATREELREESHYLNETKWIHNRLKDPTLTERQRRFYNDKLTALNILHENGEI